MKRSAPLNRTPFKRRPPKLIGFDLAREPSMTVLVRVEPVSGRIVRMAAINDADFRGAVPKTVTVRDKSYRRLVAALPCIRCGIAGFSQAAHPNTGKGAGTKADDSDCFPLCADRPGVRGCHSAFDQGAMFSKAERRAVEQEWGERTRRMIDAQ